MKKYLPASTFLFLAICLSACGSAIETTSESAVSGVYTAAAETLSVQTTFVQASATSMPTSTNLPPATSNSIPVTATHQTGVISYSIPSDNCDNSIYISDITIPDGTILAPGEAFVKTWMFQNTGSCAWSSSYSLVFISGDKMNGSQTSIDQSVTSGSTTDISVSLTAPDSTGTYTGYWALSNASDTAFGESVYVQIIVSNDAATITPTPTSTSDSDETATLTQTETPNETLTPASTDIPVGTSTDLPTTTDTYTPVPTEIPPTDTATSTPIVDGN